MKDQDHEIAVRAVTGDLSSDELNQWRARLDGDPRLRAEMERTEKTAELLRATRSEGFPLGFTARVVQRVSSEREHEGPLAAYLLLRHFRRLAPLALAAGLVLGGYVLRSGRASGQSAVEALLGLPPLNAEALVAAEATTPLDGPVEGS
jgi:anti-sigma factor RsiW